MLHGPLSPKRLCRLGSTFSLILLVFCVACVAAADVQLDVVETKKIWDRAPHNAFTDLVRWNDRFYCAFREGQGHAGDIGKLRIITSADGDQWGSAGLLALKDYDLRDAALSVTPDNRLMVLGGAQKVADGQRRTGTFVSFSEDGEAFTEPEIVLPLMSLALASDLARRHGLSAFRMEPSRDNRAESALLKTKDGNLNYEVVI